MSKSREVLNQLTEAKKDLVLGDLITMRVKLEQRSDELENEFNAKKYDDEYKLITELLKLINNYIAVWDRFK